MLLSPHWISFHKWLLSNAALFSHLDIVNTTINKAFEGLAARTRSRRRKVSRFERPEAVPGFVKSQTQDSGAKGLFIILPTRLSEDSFGKITAETFSVTTEWLVHSQIRSEERVMNSRSNFHTMYVGRRLALNSLDAVLCKR